MSKKVSRRDFALTSVAAGAAAPSSTPASGSAACGVRRGAWPSRRRMPRTRRTSAWASLLPLARSPGRMPSRRRRLRMRAGHSFARRPIYSADKGAG